MTKLSIIIPYRNVEKYISKCLSTVLYQSLEDIEVICINDASEDTSRDIVKEYAKKDKRILMLDTNCESGQSYARNLGLEIASGEYIGFVDADDWVELDMFEKLYNKAKLVDADITMCQAQLFDDKKQEMYTDGYYLLKSLEKFADNVFNSNDAKDEILDINVVLWNKIYKKEFLDRVQAKFAQGYIYEDMPFFFETFLKAEKINIVWEKLYYYRQNGIASTMQKSNKKVYDRVDMAAKTYELLKQAPFYEEKKDDILRWVVDDIFHRYTLLDAIYYEEYYRKMREFYVGLNLSEEEKDMLKTGYCYEEFCSILENDYFGFWKFLIEKYKTSNKRIKATEHKCNEDVIAIKNYIEEYKAQVVVEKEEIATWWKSEVQRSLEEQKYKFEAQKNQDMVKQEYELKKWNFESLRQQEEKLTANFKWKLEEQKQHYMIALNEQKNYYENNYLLVKIMLKVYKKLEQIKNKINKILKKN